MTALFALLLAATGFHGVVSRGPTQPVCQAGDSCTAPAVGAVLVFSRSGRDVARVRAGDGGRYTVRLAPGYYAVRTATTQKIGTGLRPRSVHVSQGVYGRLDFLIDTGIR